MKDFLMKIKKERSIRDRIAFFFFLSFLNDIEKEDEEKGRRKWRKRYFSIESRLIFERTIETDNRLNKKKILRIKLEKKKKKKEIFFHESRFFHESPPVFVVGSELKYAPRKYFDYETRGGIPSTATCGIFGGGARCAPELIR